MGKVSKTEPPKHNFPYRISRRIAKLSVPRRYMELPDAPTYRIFRRGSYSCPDRINDAAYPYIRNLLLLKRMYKHLFSMDRITNIDKLIEGSNQTIYSKLANCVLNLKNRDKEKDMNKKRGWTESEWKKHMDYISQISMPRRDFAVADVKRGKIKPLLQLMPRIREMARLPEFKMYRRLSQEVWYRDPIKVPPSALKYVISDRTKKLSAPRVMPPSD